MFAYELVDSKKDKWISTSSGISFIDKEKRHTKLFSTYEDYHLGFAWNLEEDTNGRIWFGLVRNIFNINLNTHKIQRLEIPENIVINRADVFRFVAVDSRGLPIKSAVVKLIAYRPSDANADFTSAMEEIAPGMYQTGVSFPLPGVWDLRLNVQSGEQRYELEHRISVIHS